MAYNRCEAVMCFPERNTCGGHLPKPYGDTFPRISKLDIEQIVGQVRLFVER